ncbi:MAG: flagellar biosynthetic protein FliO [Acidimicrobiales bacterium]
MSTFWLMLRLLTALAFVGGLLWFMARAAKAGRLGFLLGGGPTHETLEVTSQRPLGRSASVALVRAGERHFLLGVSDHGVQLLAEGDDLHTTTAPDDDPSVEMIGQDDRIDLADHEIDVHSPTTNRQAASKHLSAMFTPTQPRMTLIESLRELTVRKP